MEKLEAIMKYYEISEDNKDEIDVNDNEGISFSVHGDDLYVVNEDERDELLKEHIEDTLFAFNPSFLSGTTGLPEVVFQKLAELHEDGNEAIKSIIEATCGMEDVIDDAVSSDGYGNFISSYDGEEVELDGGYFLYKM